METEAQVEPTLEDQEKPAATEAVDDGEENQEVPIEA